jgi:dihydrofolate reductase
LDGYIAGPKGEADWIIMNPEIDFRAVFEQFDTFLVGRRTFETMERAGRAETPGMKTFVFSRTLRQQDYPGVRVVAEKSEETVAAYEQSRARTSGCSVAVLSFAVFSTQVLWIRWRSLLFPYFSVEGFPCSHRRPGKRN